MSDDTTMTTTRTQAIQSLEKDLAEAKSKIANLPRLKQGAVTLLRLRAEVKDLRKQLHAARGGFR